MTNEETIGKVEEAIQKISSTMWDIEHIDVPNLDYVADEINELKSAANNLTDISEYGFEVPTTTELAEAKEALEEALAALNAQYEQRFPVAKNLFIENIGSLTRNMYHIPSDLQLAFTNSFHMNSHYAVFQDQEFYDKIVQFITRLAAENVKALHEMMYTYFSNRENIEDRIPVIEVTTQSELNRSERNK